MLSRVHCRHELKSALNMLFVVGVCWEARTGQSNALFPLRRWGIVQIFRSAACVSAHTLLIFCSWRRIRPIAWVLGGCAVVWAVVGVPAQIHSARDSEIGASGKKEVMLLLCGVSVISHRNVFSRPFCIGRGTMLFSLQMLNPSIRNLKKQTEEETCKQIKVSSA